MPEGQVDASDIHDHKIDLINFNIKKLRLTNIKAFQHDATKPYDKHTIRYLLMHHVAD